MTDSTPLPDGFNNITESRRSNFSTGAKDATNNWDATVAGVTDLAKNDNVHTAGYFVPGLGTAMLAEDSYHDFEKGDWGSGLVNLGLAGLNLVPLGSVVGGIAKGAKAVTKIGAKALPKAIVKKAPKNLYPNLKDFKGKPIKTKDIDPEAKNVFGKPKFTGLGKPPKVKVPKVNKGGFFKGAATGYLANEALDALSGGSVDGVTDRQLSAAVSRATAFKEGASN
jgi:hypothetical protein